MKIYTKTGDHGETSLNGGKRVSKDNIRVEAYGTIDELNSTIGVCRSVNVIKSIDEILEKIQNDLFTLATDLATPTEKQQNDIVRIDKPAVTNLEKQIDQYESQLVPLKKFILPGGNQIGAMLHLARTVCRRAERLVVKISHEELIGNHSIIYLNRLSDLLFVLARHANALSNTPEIKWHPK